MQHPALRLAVVGHTEWVRFARVDRVPTPGAIVHSTDSWEGPGGAGGVAAAQLAELAGTSTFFTALGADELGARSTAALRERGVRVRAATRDAPTRTALAMIDPGGERTIVTLGERLEPHGDDPLPWKELARADGVYVSAGDDEALRQARRARVVVVTTRILSRLASSGITADVVIGSAHDPDERTDPTSVPGSPGLIVLTEGARGGEWWSADGRSGRYEAAAAPGPVRDTYGAGDSFQAGLTFALAAGMDVPAALEFAARCGAVAVTRPGPGPGRAGTPIRPPPDAR